MKVKILTLFVVAALTIGVIACGGGGGNSTPPPVTQTYVLTVNSTNPASGVAITASPADNSSHGNGNTSFTRTYNSGTSVTLTAPSTANGNNFSSWSGCTSTSGATCTVTLTANKTVVASYTTPTFTLTVNSTNPASGVAIAASPADNSSQGNGNTSFTRTYNSGTSVTLTAPSTASGNNFSSWTGCSSSSGASCSVTMNGDKTVVASYTPAAGVTISPGNLSLVAGQSQQFTATVPGLPSSGVSWTVNGIAVDGGSHKSGNTTVGFIDNSSGHSGVYDTPYPASGSVTITATSTVDTSKSGSITVTLSNPTSATGPVLSVDAGAQTHAINPLIYGVNAWPLDATLAAAIRPTVDRWGGNVATSYNYKLDIANRGSDWYFATYSSTNGQDNSDFNQKVVGDRNAGVKPMGTVPVVGWTPTVHSASGPVCSFSVAKYGPQKETMPSNSDCGNGVKLDGSNVVNDPTDLYSRIDETWAGGWAQYLVGKFGDAAHGGVAIYSLDNEPEWWIGVHRDVHPQAFTYDEVTNNGLAVAKAVKAADPTAEISGPVISYWPTFFYSMKDVHSGWASGPHWIWNGNPVDRNAHGGVPLLEYYLQQFKAAQDADPNHTRFLDYLDLHTYLSPTALQGAGSSIQQQAMLNSTRGLWDPTYTDPNTTDPNDVSGNAPAVAPMIIRRMQTWISNNYPGTKTASTEYNWGMLEHISGGVAQADVLGIFGREGLDLATIWGTPDPNTQKPGINAFKIYRNYDGAGGEFGDMGVTATSADQGKLSVYAAMRTKDNVLTVVVINKTFGDLRSDLPLANFTTSSAAKVYQYTNADLTQIKHLSDLTVTPPESGSTTSTIKNVTFPAMSITLFTIPRS